MALLIFCRNPCKPRDSPAPGGRSSRIAVGEVGKAVRIPKFTGCRDIALEVPFAMSDTRVIHCSPPSTGPAVESAGASEPPLYSMVQEPVFPRSIRDDQSGIEAGLVGHEREEQRRDAIVDLNHHVGVVACNETRHLRVIERDSSQAAHGMEAHVHVTATDRHRHVASRLPCEGHRQFDPFLVYSHCPCSHHRGHINTRDSRLSTML